APSPRDRVRHSPEPRRQAGDRCRGPEESGGIGQRRHRTPRRVTGRVARSRTLAALYTLDLPTHERLAPDLIVTQTVCDVCAVAEAEVAAAAGISHPRRASFGCRFRTA